MSENYTGVQWSAVHRLGWGLAKLLLGCATSLLSGREGEVVASTEYNRAPPGSSRQQQQQDIYFTLASNVR